MEDDLNKNLKREDDLYTYTHIILNRLQDYSYGLLHSTSSPFLNILKYKSHSQMQPV
jgi:hypothetical protein